MTSEHTIPSGACEGHLGYTHTHTGPGLRTFPGHSWMFWRSRSSSCCRSAWGSRRNRTSRPALHSSSIRSKRSPSAVALGCVWAHSVRNWRAERTGGQWGPSWETGQERSHCEPLAMLGRSEISREASADSAALRWQCRGCERLMHQCWQPMQCLQWCQACGNSRSWPVGRAWAGHGDSHVTHLIDVAQADVQGSLLAGVLLLTPARAGLPCKHSKARQRQREGNGNGHQGERGGGEPALAQGHRAQGPSTQPGPRVPIATAM